MYLKRQLNPDDADAIVKLGIAGVNAQREYKRYYPSGEVLAHVIGVTNVDDRGQEGLELAFDDWLAGTPGAEHVIRDNKGHTVEDVELLREPKPGRDLTLSIDRRIQYMAYRELKSAIIDHHAMSGSMVVLDVQTGEILAMVNQPSFNPNAHGNMDLSFRRNRAITDVVEPGSTVKAFTIAAALESGKWTLASHVDTNPGWYKIATWTIHDVHNHGLLDLTGVITKSSNIGAAKIAETLSRDSLYDMFHRFGFGESTGSGFPGESPGLLPVVTAWGPVEKATISYGYGLNVTPLQLAQAYAALAHDGRIRAPTFVKGARNPDNAIIDPEIAHAVVKMLETVVQPGGTAYPMAVVANYLVGGKTGTARMAHAGTLSEQICIYIRRLRAGERAAPGRRGRDPRRARSALLRRRCLRARLRESDGRRAAHHGCAARQRAALVRGRTRDAGRAAVGRPTRATTPPRKCRERAPVRIARRASRRSIRRAIFP